jgi:CheY-like chemotaxis protein
MGSISPTLSPAAAIASASPLHAAPGGYLLVVDDEPAIRRLVSLMIARDGYVIRPAGDGQEALDITRDAPPSLILLDLHMPVMDGWEFLDEYEKQPGHHAPIVIFSSRADDLRANVRSRVADCLQKPVTRDLLLQTLRRLWPPA